MIRISDVKRSNEQYRALKDSKKEAYDKYVEAVRNGSPRVVPPSKPGSMESLPVNDTLAVVVGKLPTPHQKWTSEAVDKLLEYPDREEANGNLVGHIQKEFKLPLDWIPDSFTEYLNILIGRHYFPDDWAEKPSSVKFYHAKPPWVNYQEKHEFNPPHAHSGFFSYNIWKRIPYDIEEEKNYYNKCSNSSPGSFSFISPIVSRTVPYAHYPLAVKTFDMDKDWEECICIFPSQLQHFVTPFRTTDDLRVSIAGNLIFDHNNA